MDLKGGAEELEEKAAAGRRAGRQRSTFDGDAFTGPLLLKGGEAFLLPDADDVLLEVELLGVEAQEAEPQLPHRLRVGLQLREDLVLHTGHTDAPLLPVLQPPQMFLSRCDDANGPLSKLTRSLRSSQKKAFQPSTIR